MSATLTGAVTLLEAVSKSGLTTRQVRKLVGNAVSRLGAPQFCSCTFLSIYIFIQKTLPYYVIWE